MTYLKQVSRKGEYLVLLIQNLEHSNESQKFYELVKSAQPEYSRHLVDVT